MCMRRPLVNTGHYYGVEPDAAPGTWDIPGQQGFGKGEQ
jgi:hypothetical protein